MSDLQKTGQKKIGVFISDWNYNAVYMLLSGIEAFLETRDDISVEIFNNFGGGRSAEQRKGLGIFDLPDISSYDGIIIEGDQAFPVEFRKKVVDRILALGRPAVSVNYELEGCTMVGTDNYGALFELTEHVLSVHGVTRLAFVQGNHFSLEATERERGFEDACRKYGLDPEEMPRYGGTWFVESGKQAARKMLQEYGKEKLPQAVICANDDLASGVLDIFLKNGVRIPEDVIVTGFDHLDLGALNEPAVTTIERNYRQTMQDALKLISDRIDGRPTPDAVYTSHKLITTESCGCSMVSIPMRELKQSRLELTNELRIFYNEFEELFRKLRGKSTISEVAPELEEYLGGMSSGGFYLVLHTDYLEHSRISWKKQDTIGVVIAARANGIGEKPVKDPDADHYGEVAKGSLLAPGMEAGSKLLLCYPLLCNDDNIGYIVFEGLPRFAKFNILEMMLVLLGSDIDTIRQRSVVEALNARLDELYVRDEMTGLYNRFGMDRYGKEFFEELSRQDRNTDIYFIDIDCMKEINDRHGHLEGDRAIRTVACAVRKICQKKKGQRVGIRYGGDEFLLLGEQEDDLTQVIQEEVEKAAAEAALKARLTVSVGRACAHAGGSFEQIVREADEKMYRIKHRKHM